MMARAVPPIEPASTAVLLSFDHSTQSITGTTGAPMMVPQKSKQYQYQGKG